MIKKYKIGVKKRWEICSFVLENAVTAFNLYKPKESFDAESAQNLLPLYERVAN